MGKIAHNKRNEILQKQNKSRDEKVSGLNPVLVAVVCVPVNQLDNTGTQSMVCVERECFPAPGFSMSHIFEHIIELNPFAYI